MGDYVDGIEEAKNKGHKKRGGAVEPCPLGNAEAMNHDAAKHAVDSKRWDHAYRHLHDAGFINGTKNSKVARDHSKEFVLEILTNPLRTFDYQLQGAATKGYYKIVDGKDVVVFVTKHDHGRVLQGQVLGAWVPTKAKNPDIMSLIQ